jgi:hypothetical protein
MTVKELRDKLAALPDDSIVLAPGYECGYFEVKTVREDWVRSENSSGWYGEYEDGKTEETKGAVRAAILEDEDD